jgi:hypothetical protein
MQVNYLVSQDVLSSGYWMISRRLETDDLGKPWETLHDLGFHGTAKSAKQALERYCASADKSLTGWRTHNLDGQRIYTAQDYTGNPMRSIRPAVPTVSELRYNHERERWALFFSPHNMKFAGDTMGNFGIEPFPARFKTYGGELVQCWALYRKRKTSKGFGPGAFAYFNCETFAREHKPERASA